MLDPKDGTDYWLGGLDADRDKGLQWISGAEMVCPLLELLLELWFKFVVVVVVIVIVVDADREKGVQWNSGAKMVCC